MENAERENFEQALKDRYCLHMLSLDYPNHAVRPLKRISKKKGAKLKRLQLTDIMLRFHASYHHKPGSLSVLLASCQMLDRLLCQGNAAHRLLCRESRAKDEKYRPIQKSSKKKKELVSQGEKKGFGR